MLEGSHWLVTTVAGVTVPEEARRRVEFSSDRIVGQVGVNRFSAPYEISGALMRVGAGMTTRMAGPPEHMELEAAFLRALSGEHVLTLDGDRLLVGPEASGIVLVRDESA